MIFIKTFETAIIGYVLGGVVAFIGMILDFIEEIVLAKKLKNINNREKVCLCLVIVMEQY